MAQYIDKDALVAEIKRLKKEDGNPYFPSETADKYYARGVHFTCDGLVNFLDTLEVKDVNEVPATVMVNKYGNRFISSWSGLKEYDDLKEGQEIKILIPKK